MEKNHPIVEPDFEGEVMKLPTVNTGRPVAAPVRQSVLSLPIIIILFLLLSAILSGFYYWYTIVMKEASLIPVTTRPTNEQNNEPESTTAEARTGVLDVVSTSDELSAISADVMSTNLDDLENEVPAIETELNAALGTKP